MRAIAEKRSVFTVAAVGLLCPAKPVGRWKCAPARASWFIALASTGTASRGHRAELTMRRRTASQPTFGTDTVNRRLVS
jgi:hypothetical protein